VATFGDIRLRITKTFPALDPDLIDSWIDERYSEILGRLPWERQRTESVLVTVAPYGDGAVSLSRGSPIVTGLGTGWTNDLTGRGFRVQGRSEIYEFTRLDVDMGQLDRPYEGPDGPASYQVFQYLYPLPADCAMVEALSWPGAGVLDRTSHGALEISAAGRPAVGSPELWAPYMDDGSDPPQVQIELYPIPDQVRSYPLSYFRDVSALSSGGTSANLLPWLNPGCLIEGVRASALDHLQEWAGADRAEARFERLLEQMISADARRAGPKVLRMAERFTDFRVLRQLRSVRNPRMLP
jgi:hypothetical protein